MSLRHAAVLTLSLIALPTLFAAQTASALDGIDLSNPVPAPAEGECAALVKIKYPFVRCGGSEGAPQLLQARPIQANPTWAAVRQIPIMSAWTEGDGAWGPDLNQD